MSDPSSLSELLGQDVVKYIDLSSTHLLFYGPPGSGKSTAAKIITRGADVLYMNASTDRKIDDIRTTVAQFSKIPPIIKLRFVVLDECDNLTAQAQDALKRIIEISDTRFIFICNYISAIIPPIISRCVCVEFKSVPFSDCVNFLKEHYPHLSEDIVVEAAKICGGDIRRLKKIAADPIPTIKQQHEIDSALQLYTDRFVGEPLKFAQYLQDSALPLLPILFLAKCDDRDADFERLCLMYDMAHQCDKPTCGSSREQAVILFARGIEVWQTK